MDLRNFINLTCVIWILTFISIRCADNIYTDSWAVHIEGGEEFAKQLIAKHGFVYINEIMPDHYHVRHHRVMKRSLRPSPHHHETLSQEPEVHWIEQQIVRKRVKRDLSFNDPKWQHMWYLKRGQGLDMNVLPAWEKGYRGQGVVVSILDDGIEKDHPDLKKNYDAKASYDVNNNDNDPQPRYDYTNENRHGTRCAGEVAAEANNGICSVGVAYEAGIGGVRMLDGDVTDAVEARSLSLEPQHIDVYSASWGPDDDGRTVDGPATLAKKAFADGIKNGRGGKGSIFVWASGNGGRDHDSCNCDGYTNSIYTISVSSATEKEVIPWYSEPCSSTLATTYSSGSSREHEIVTTDLRKQCTESHTGTSASAPLAAGICALALSANKDLTWRDLQHIIVMTARPSELHASDWLTNGVGRKVSHNFGFGLMDASAMVDLALNWTNVPKQHKCEIRSTDTARAININGRVQVSLESNGCKDTANEVNYLEHVQAVVTLTATRRGQVTIYLTSPTGTRSTLLPKRSRDMSSDGFSNWAFMTTHSWGELSLGTWQLEIDNDGTSSTLKEWKLVLYGTATDPLVEQTQRHPIPHNQDCEPGRSKLMDFCVKDCPISFYAANETTRVEQQEPHPVTSPASSSGSSTPTPSQPINGAKQTLTTLIGAPPAGAPSSTPSSVEVSTTLSVNNSTVVATVTCKPCAEGCAKCTGPEPEACTQCLIDFEKNSQNICKSTVITHSKGVILAIILILCVASVCVFVLIFAVLQYKDKCFKTKHKYSTLSSSSDDDSDIIKYSKSSNGTHKVHIPDIKLGSPISNLPVTKINNIKPESVSLLSSEED